MTPSSLPASRALRSSSIPNSSNHVVHRSHNSSNNNNSSSDDTSDTCLEEHSK